MWTFLPCSDLLTPPQTHQILQFGCCLGCSPKQGAISGLSERTTTTVKTYLNSSRVFKAGMSQLLHCQLGRTVSNKRRFAHGFSHRILCCCQRQQTVQLSKTESGCCPEFQVFIKLFTKTVTNKVSMKCTPFEVVSGAPTLMRKFVKESTSSCLFVSLASARGACKASTSGLQYLLCDLVADRYLLMAHWGDIE